MGRFSITLEDELIEETDKKALESKQSRNEYIRGVLVSSLHQSGAPREMVDLQNQVAVNEAVIKELRARITFLEAHAHQLLARIPELPPARISWWHRLFGE